MARDTEYHIDLKSTGSAPGQAVVSLNAGDGKKNDSITISNDDGEHLSNSVNRPLDFAIKAVPENSALTIDREHNSINLPINQVRLAESISGNKGILAGYLNEVINSKGGEEPSFLEYATKKMPAEKAEQFKEEVLKDALKQTPHTRSHQVAMASDHGLSVPTGIPGVGGSREIT